MWAKDKVCFQHLVLNEMRQNTNTDRWIAGMIGTETEVARTIEAWMQRRGGILDHTTKAEKEESNTTSAQTPASHHHCTRHTGENVKLRKNTHPGWST